ncbi:KTSC domain-containing protein [Paenibacillus sp. FSL R7-0048]|uniref:KTSC domain-containing protein n=1 Tax=unclassified Paenibacillus TaxID=185978 RepID=UPI0030DB568B
MRHDLEPVVSSNIAAVGYDTESQTLFVQFKGRDTVYEHPGVPRLTYEIMMAAESIGSYYARNIKKTYPGTAAIGVQL